MTTNTTTSQWAVLHPEGRRWWDANYPTNRGLWTVFPDAATRYTHEREARAVAAKVGGITVEIRR